MIKIAGTYIVWDNKLLIHKRNETGSEASWHKFASPGGKLEEGEDFITAALRELEEESGLKLTKKGFQIIKKITSEKANSVMYMCNLPEKPDIKGPNSDSKKAIDLKFKFKDIEGESAGKGTGYYWADIESLIDFLDKNEKYNNPYFYDNLKLVQKKLNSRKNSTNKKHKTRKLRK